MSRADVARARALRALAALARREGLGRLTDFELVLLMDEQRWAVGRLADTRLDLEVHAELNTAVLEARAVLSPRPKVKLAPLGPALARCRKAFGLTLLTFLAAGVLAWSAVLTEPVLAVALVSRELLSQIGEHAWGSRPNVAAGVGMTLFYWANNLRASLLALGLGVLGIVPGLAVVAFNGLMLGAVAGVAFHKGVEDRLLAWVAPHCVPEVCALVLCGAIGAEMGRSLLAPGSLRRREALGRSGYELMPLVLVAAGLVLCAAPLEGFVAPLRLPLWLDLAIAGGWIFMLGGLARSALRAMRRVGARSPAGRKPTPSE